MTSASQQLRKDHRLVLLSVIMLLCFFSWAYFFELVEVSSGTGKVVPSSREQVVQSLAGGVLASLAVRQGDIVEKGQLLAQLDPTQSAANVAESGARYYAAIATAARLRAEVSGASKIDFPESLADHQELIATEKSLFASRRQGLNEQLSGLNRSLELLDREVGISQRLQTSGAASLVELTRLQRQQAEARIEISKLRDNYMVQAREELAKANADAQVYESEMQERSDKRSQLSLRAPMRGVVQDVAVMTIGGVISPNGELLTIVPLDDKLMIEARISPRDVAFLHPGQKALVKFTSYDYAIYGGLEGKVVNISPNTVRDEVKPEIFYYRVYIETVSDSLKNAKGKRFPIVPGMVATVDIQTGSKTVWQYLIKPFNRAQEALRER